MAKGMHHAGGAGRWASPLPSQQTWKPSRQGSQTQELGPARTEDRLLASALGTPRDLCPLCQPGVPGTTACRGLLTLPHPLKFLLRQPEMCTWHRHLAPTCCSPVPCPRVPICTASLLMGWTGAWLSTTAGFEQTGTRNPFKSDSIQVKAVFLLFLILRPTKPMAGGHERPCPTSSPKPCLRLKWTQRDYAGAAVLPPCQ